MTQFTLSDLEALVADRAAASPETSYTAKLLAGGPAKPAKKLGEEAVEAAIAAVQGDRSGLVSEAEQIPGGSDTRTGGPEKSLNRRRLRGGVDVTLPVASRRDDVLAAIGDLDFSLGGDLEDLSDFGTLRTQRSRRVAWLDHHNLLGIVAILAVLFLPVPAVLIDVGLAFSIALSVLIFMLALWI